MFFKVSTPFQFLHAIRALSADSIEDCFPASIQMSKYFAFSPFINQVFAMFFAVISKPCLLLTGENDGGCSPKHNEIMANEIKNSKLVILSKYKHSFLIEAPNEVAESLIRFINE